MDRIAEVSSKQVVARFTKNKRGKQRPFKGELITFLVSYMCSSFVLRLIQYVYTLCYFAFEVGH